MSNFKSGFVSIIGKTNAGKSTLINNFINANISITSKKTQTTRKNIKGIYNDEDSQIVFIDTPGIHKAKNKLDTYMDMSIKKYVSDVDLIIYLIDILNFDVAEEKNKISELQTDFFLVFNKIDKLEQETFEEKKSLIEKEFKNLLNIKKIYYISSLRNKNINELISDIKSKLPQGPKYYEDDMLSDATTKEIVAEIIRQQCLYKLDKEIPHGIYVVVSEFKEKKDIINISANIYVEKDRHKAIVIGKAGNMLKEIGIASRIYIEKFLYKKVNLKLLVLVKENWRDKELQLKDFGFDIKEV